MLGVGEVHYARGEVNKGVDGLRSLKKKKAGKYHLAPRMKLNNCAYSEVLNDQTAGALGISRKWRAIDPDAFGPFPADAAKICGCISEQPRCHAVSKAAAEDCEPYDDEEQDFQAVARFLIP
jgi:hypothetical protein